MGKILVPNQPSLSGKPEPPKVKVTIIFQDEHYTFMRNKEVLTQEDVLNVPLHMFLISLGMLDSHQYVPRVGKEAYLTTLKKLKKQFDEMYKVQKAIATNMKVEIKKGAEL